MTPSLSQIRNLISENQLKQAIEQLLLLTEEQQDLHYICVIQSSQYAALRSQEMKNTISNVDSRLIRSQIMDALLAVITNLNEKSTKEVLSEELGVPIEYANWRLDQKMKLVDLLLQCKSLQTEQGRNNIIDELPLEIRSRMPRGNNPRLDIKNILDTYSNFTAHILGLIDILEIYEGETNSMKVVKTFLNS